MITNRSFPRWLSAVLGGLTYLIINVAIETGFPDHWAGSPDRLIGLSYAGWSRLLWIPQVLILIGLAALYRQIARAPGLLGKAGYWVAAAGLGLEIIGVFIEFWLYGVFLVPFLGEFTTGSTGSNLGYSIASIGTMTAILGFLLLGTASLQRPTTSIDGAAVAPWRFLPSIIALAYVSIFYFYFSGKMVIHAILIGSVWMTAGYLLRRLDGTI